MDLVVCEAPLDNSFQKDRRELVNKGSLGRRRKPSRSTLKLILSPANAEDGFYDSIASGPRSDSRTPETPNAGRVPGHLHTSPVTNGHKAAVCSGPRASFSLANVLRDSEQKGTVLNGSDRHNNNFIILRKTNCLRDGVERIGYQEGKCNGYQGNRNGNAEGNSCSRNHLNASSANSDSRSHQLTTAFRNRQNLIAPSSHVNAAASTPAGRAASSRNKPELNGKSCVKIHIEPAKEVSELVADARRFSVDSKARRNRSEGQGRSAVLIQTWERRTQAEKKTHPGRDLDSRKRASSVPSVLVSGDSSERSMLYKVPQDTSRGVRSVKVAQNGAKLPVTNGGLKNKDEPEWISLSRKLCAKFVEGHIDSPASYPHEEPEGVEAPSPTDCSTPRKTAEPTPSRRAPAQPVKKLVAAPCDENGNSEPPWVHLSRKLCTKFIEQHIEYPPVTNGQYVKVPELVEPNGDVRIIEKVGQPKAKKSRQKKESEPEWVSLSKKLRAKFIESHLDDPDSIALDGQLPDLESEETSSESLSDVSQDIPVPEVIRPSPETKNEAKCKQEVEEEKKETIVPIEDYSGQPCVESDKECSWEFQEIEFDQESNSGTFHDQESFDEPLQEVRVQRGPIPQDRELLQQKSRSFADLESSSSFSNLECFNNDVRFPASINVEPLRNPPQEKLFTVQFIAPQSEKKSSSSNDSISRSFFNLSTWEESHLRSNSPDSLSNSLSFYKDYKSKSMDNLCDSLDTGVVINISNCSGGSQKESSSENRREDSTKPGDYGSITSAIKCNGRISSAKSDTNLHSIIIKNYPETEERRYEFRENTLKPLFTSKADECSDDDVFHNKSPSVESESQTKNSNLEILDRNDDFYKAVDVGTREKINNTESSNHVKCNGMIPNSIYDTNNFQDSKSVSMSNCTNKQIKHDGFKKESKLGMSKWITISKSEQNLNKDQTAKQSSFKKENNDSNLKSNLKEIDTKNRNASQSDGLNVSKETPTSSNNESDTDESKFTNFNRYTCNKNIRMKCKSLCDIPQSIMEKESSNNTDSPADSSFKKIEFQHFESASDIPLCAKLVSKHNKKKSSSSSSSNRNESPCPSDSSHIYEDMFKETPTFPSDSETSSWTAVKGNNYYVSGRSSSLNDLDCSDSGSLSVKCDYASSSENSTLQSRNSSVASSSFYVNLRDYDSHMFEDIGKGARNGNCNGSAPHLSKSNPPTPESLRHLFTSPLNSIHSNRLIHRMPSDPQSHYYSSTAAASSAFKHGFSLTPPKPKKAERSSSIKIKDIAHGIILTFKRFQNHSKNSSLSPNQYVDVSHLAEMKSNGNSEHAKPKSKKSEKEARKQHRTSNGRTDNDSGFQSDVQVQMSKARRSSSDITGMKPAADSYKEEKIKSKNAKKVKGKKNRSKITEARPIPTVSRKIQQMADGTLYLVTTVSGDSSMPGVYSDSPDTSSELSTHKPIKITGESNC